MNQNAQWVWRITAVTPEAGDGRALGELLDDGWEPFAVTINVHGHSVYHLRRKVRK